MTPITLHSISKQFGKTVALEDINLNIAAGELFFILGPSGCGKTTLLRIIAGFTAPTSGSIQFGENDVTHLAANKRQCGMVFQSYALWPHMTVEQNVAFGLGVRKVRAADKQTRVEGALRRVQMLSLIARKPNELSGGEQQRVALARALVIEPTVLLLDEPLSNLDAKLRLEMRSQIRRICKNVGITAVYVTHDQQEALSMADRLAVLSAGTVMQVGDPRSLYERPTSRFVADFLGETNFLGAEVIARENDLVVLESPVGKIRSATFPPDIPATGNVTCSIRPEAVRMVRPGAPQNSSANFFDARLVDQIYLGAMAQHQLAIGDTLTIKAFELNPRPMNRSGMTVKLAVDPHDIVILQD